MSGATSNAGEDGGNVIRVDFRARVPERREDGAPAPLAPHDRGPDPQEDPLGWEEWMLRDNGERFEASLSIFGGGRVVEVNGVRPELMDLGCAERLRLVARLLERSARVLRDRAEDAGPSRLGHLIFQVSQYANGAMATWSADRLGDSASEPQVREWVARRCADAARMLVEPP